MLEVLSTAVDKLTGVDTPSMDSADLHASVIELQRQIDRLSACQSQLLSPWNSRKLWAEDGSKSAGSRLARETGLSATDAKHLVHRARRLSSMPLTLAAFIAGKLSTSRVDLLVRANRPEVADQFVRDEEMLLSTIATLSFGDATKAIVYWSQCADENRTENRAQRQVEQRTADAVKTFEGAVDLKALFDPVNGEIFLNELERIDRELFEADWAEAKSVHAEHVTTEHLARTPSQRRCDALVEMAKRSSSMPADAKSPRPLISVLVDYKSFTRVCELASGTVVSPGQLSPLLQQGDIERIVFDGQSRVIDVGKRTRLFKGALRRAIELRDRHCQHVSVCDEPIAQCQADHTLAFAGGGETEQANGKLMCAFHNRAKGSGPP